MENMEYRQPDTETVKQSADFYKDALDLPDSIMDKYTQAMQEKVASIVEGTNNQEGQLIESMNNIDLLPNEKQLQEQLACASLFNQVNSYMESCNVA